MPDADRYTLGTTARKKRIYCTVRHGSSYVVNPTRRVHSPLVYEDLNSTHLVIRRVRLDWDEDARSWVHMRHAESPRLACCATRPEGRTVKRLSRRGTEHIATLHQSEGAQAILWNDKGSSKTDDRTSGILASHLRQADIAVMSTVHFAKPWIGDFALLTSAIESSSGIENRAGPSPRSGVQPGWCVFREFPSCGACSQSQHT